jgi:hypothetical protein
MRKRIWASILEGFAWLDPCLSLRSPDGTGLGQCGCPPRQLLREKGEPLAGPPD